MRNSMVRTRRQDKYAKKGPVKAPAPYFEAMGRKVATQWMAKSFNEEAFPKIASNALRESPPSASVDSLEVLRSFQADWSIPQMDSLGLFGQPPITVFHHPRFHIDVYFWLDGTTTIHQHSFSGAFHVLAGSSVHAQYSFSTRYRVNSALLIGDMSLASVDLLKVGDTREIVAGSRFVHSLFHLDRPSCTVVIRTPSDPADVIQYNYYWPYIAEAPMLAKFSASRREAISTLRELDPSGYQKTIRDALRRANFFDCYVILHGLQSLVDDDVFASMARTARQRHGERVDLAVASFRETRRRSHLVARRQTIHNPEHRFFLALLLNLEDRESIMSLVRRRFPKVAAHRTVLRWLKELGDTESLRQDKPNALGLKFTEAEMLLVEYAVRGLKPDDIRQRLAKQYGEDQVKEQGSLIGKFYDALRESPFFQTLVSSENVGAPRQHR